ncbi:VOC family protein [Eisenbergiella sp.]
MKRENIIGLVHNSMYQQIKKNGYAAPVQVLMDVGVLCKEDYEKWRAGRVDYLERVCNVNLSQLSAIMREIRNYAQKSSLKESWTCYKKWGQKKQGRTEVLRFSKSGDLQIERAYATHYLDTKLVRRGDGKQKTDEKEGKMEGEVLLGNVMIDCDDGKTLQKFYGKLLDWEMCEMFGKPAVRSLSGVVFLFAEEADYSRPIWPEEKGKQQKQMHFDFQVDNVTEMVGKAETLGAVKADVQFGGKDFVTMFDPAGHPFCLCQKG